MPNPPFSSAQQVGTPHKNNGFHECPKGGSTIATDYSHSPIGGTIDHVDPPLDVANCRAIKNTSLTLTKYCCICNNANSLLMCNTHWSIF